MASSGSVGALSPPKILTIGFGALGCLYSFILSQAGAEITAVARSNYQVVKDKGIWIDSVKLGSHKGWKPHRVVQSAQEALDQTYDCELMMMAT